MPLMKSWIASANDPTNGFPLNNLPYGVFDDGRGPRAGVAIGDKVLDLGALEGLSMVPAVGFRKDALNSFMAEGADTWARVRNTLTGLLAEGSAAQHQLAAHLHPQAAVTMKLRSP